jgi:hypothetical protein
MAEEGPAAAEPYLRGAQRAARFMRSMMWKADERRLLRRYRAGEAGIDAYAEDYAYLIFGLLELFQADADPEWLDWAIELQRRQDELFWDDSAGGWFSTTGRDASVLLRMKEDYDGAEPTASSVSVLNLLVLSHLVEEPAWAGRIEKTLRAFGQRLEQLGRGVPMMAAALSTHLAGIQQIVLVQGESPAVGSLQSVLGRQYLPIAIQLHVTPEQIARLALRLPFVAAMTLQGGQTAVYVCRDRACRAPVSTVEDLEGALAS